LVTGHRLLKRRVSYTREWFAARESATERSAGAMVPFLFGLAHPRSVVDVGCGLGSWLMAFREQGVEEVLGIDGDHVARDLLRIPADQFRALDLREPFDLGQTFDLALSLEVAEHIPAEAAHSFVESLTRLAPVIVFSCAVPRQGGTGHVNEQWPDYWANIFSEYHFVSIDAVRPRFWSDDRVRYFYAQNTILYVRATELDSYPPLAEMSLSEQGSPLPLVHPRLYESALGRFPPPEAVRPGTLGRFALKLSAHPFQRRRRAP
jgi:SAM-dependent methyltransferase